MGMMDTGTIFEYRGIRKMLILYSCRQCPHYTYYWNKRDTELDKHYCRHNKQIRKIEPTWETLEELNIPEWCELKDYIE